MKISKIKLAGFRGIRTPIEIACGRGFTVVCGRNGTGKSTLCDAIEFTLTGTLERFVQDTERGEHISDYLWWRGANSSTEQYAAIEFVEDQNREIEFRRTPDSKHDLGNELVAHLRDEVSAPPDWLSQLCVTGIIRDETITKLSTDQTERERYEFALRAIGLASSLAIENRAVEVSRYFAQQNTAASAEYDRRRTQVESLTSELSRAQLAATKASEERIDRLRSLYSDHFRENQGSLSDLAGFVAKQISALRERIDLLSKLRYDKERFDKLAMEVSSRETDAKLAELESKQQSLEQELRDVSIQHDLCLKTIEENRRLSPNLTSLAMLREHGSRIGLRDGKCPLCGSPVSQSTFAAHLQEIDNEVKATNEKATETARKEAEARIQLDRVKQELEKHSRAYQELRAIKDSIIVRHDSLASVAKKLGVDLNASVLLREIESCTAQITSRNEDLSVIEAYVAVHRVTELQELLKGAREAADRAELVLRKISDADSIATQIQTSAKRISGEIVKERLAALEPLFLELCERLRPHSGWTDIGFLLRGDVRPFLSLTVGDGLNPRFLFSSGQRRALGLAFLLSVHLSRKWCKLQSLVLDDPVQHVDDYRALHLVECLASMRMVGRQIICTVEDPTLADLLCRRLRSLVRDDGVRVDLKYSRGEGVQIDDIRTILPMKRELIAAD